MYFGVDIGATSGRVAAFETLDMGSELGRVEFRVTKRPHGNFEEDFDKLVMSCSALALKHKQPIQGVGLAVAGTVNAKRTALDAAGNLGHWVGQPIVSRLSQILNCNVVLGNDAEAGAMAEASYGKGEGTFWFIIWGSGVGGCLIRRDETGLSAHPSELGHQHVNPQAPDMGCGCGLPGCLERHCGGDAIGELYGTPAENLSSGQWDEVAGWMKVGIYNVLMVQPVPLVVFGGGVANKQPQLLELIKQGLQADLRMVEAPNVQLSAFGESAGMLGALSLLGLK